MNLNTIRLESIWGNSQDLYDLCDKYGILVMVDGVANGNGKNTLENPVMILEESGRKRK